MTDNAKPVTYITWGLDTQLKETFRRECAMVQFRQPTQKEEGLLISHKPINEIQDLVAKYQQSGVTLKSGSLRPSP